MTHARLVLFDEIGAGGMATVHLAQRFATDGTARVVAVKRLRDGIAREDPELVTMLFDEARIARRVRHPNVVGAIDVVADPAGIMLVFEYVHGVTVAELLRRQDGPFPPRIALAITQDMLAALHAAHEATDEDGSPLRLVHRDVSPQNVIVGLDGRARVLDFGIAKASGRLRTTRDGRVRGKLGYLAPEQLMGAASVRSDVFSVAVVLWEMLTGRRLYEAVDATRLLEAIGSPPAPPSAVVADLPPNLDDVVLRGLARDPTQRYAHARDMSAAIGAVSAPASHAEVAAFVVALAGDTLAGRTRLLADIESGHARPYQRGAESADDDADVTERISTTAAPPSPAVAPSRPRTRRAAVHALVAVGAVAMVGLVVFAATRERHRDPEPERADIAPTTSARPIETMTSPPAAVDAPDTPPDTAPPDAAPAKTTGGKAKPHAPRPKADCDPPYSWSEDGARKIPKRECFH